MLIVLLSILMVLVWLLAHKKISTNRFTWEDQVILDAKSKRTRKNLRRIKENNPFLWTAAKNISRVK